MPSVATELNKYQHLTHTGATPVDIYIAISQTLQGLNSESRRHHRLILGLRDVLNHFPMIFTHHPPQNKFNRKKYPKSMVSQGKLSTNGGGSNVCCTVSHLIYPLLQLRVKTCVQLSLVGHSPLPAGTCQCLAGVAAMARAHDAFFAVDVGGFCP